jgi:hypothetical protein
VDEGSRIHPASGQTIIRGEVRPDSKTPAPGYSENVIIKKFLKIKGELRVFLMERYSAL